MRPLTVLVRARVQFFADVQVSILPPDADGRVGVVALSSPSLHAQLSAGMHGTGDRAAATSLIARAFARLVHDRFTLIYVYPSSQVGLNGAHDFQFYFRTPGGLGSLASLQGVVNGGNPLQDGFYKASMLGARVSVVAACDHAHAPPLRHMHAHARHPARPLRALTAGCERSCGCVQS
jgi:hypothetical protein